MKLEEIAENHGLTPEGVDYALTQYQIVICEITRGMLSKLSYDAKDIIRTAQERWCNTYDLKEQEPVTMKLSYFSYICSGCGSEIDCEFIEYTGGKIKFCPYCGRKVKWDA